MNVSIKKLFVHLLGLLAVILNWVACHTQPPTSQEQMLQLLGEAKVKFQDFRNEYNPQAQLAHLDSAGEQAGPVEIGLFTRADALMKLGEEEKALNQLAALLPQIKADNRSARRLVITEMALAQLRIGEQANCIANHTGEACILPIRGSGIHTNQTGSRKAIALYEAILNDNPDDLESRWLLNLAYMTLGEYPGKVPARWLIPHIVDTTNRINAFQDVAKSLKLDVNNMSGGVIIEDFDHDGYLDIVLSAKGLDEPMHYFRNNADGTFSDRSASSGLQQLTGGLNMMQTDYNNDGFADIFVVRGGWQGAFGEQPNSLLKNNGDGTFTDVTTLSGLLSFHPTQTATWNDFNNDGWLDVFIGNETVGAINNPTAKVHPCELFLNNQDGTFSEVAKLANCAITGFIKGVTSGDYNNDGWKDLFLSTMDGNRYLLKNQGAAGKFLHFEDVTAQAGLRHDSGNTFTTWFWDYDNDGWLDLFACNFEMHQSLAYYAAAEALHQPINKAGTIFLYHNNHDGTFANVSAETKLERVTFSMGGNFGDINNDGFLDMYLGSGSPSFRSLVPNKLYLNQHGKTFADITASGRVGNLQKGHGVSFADLDNDGDQDIYIELGGAFPGDAYPNSFYLNPGQNTNNWICLILKGTQANRLAIGSTIKLTFQEHGVKRSVFREVNSGGSFGASPLRREIGIGQATRIDELEVRWHGSKGVQVFHNIKPNQFLRITEGRDKIDAVALKPLNFKKEVAPVCPAPVPSLASVVSPKR